MVLLVHSTANIIFTPSNYLDERQQRVQGLTFRSAYLTLMGLAALYLVLLDGLVLSWLPLPTARLQELDVISAFVILLPITIVAWTEPDPVADA